jgi:K+ transporter
MVLWLSQSGWPARRASPPSLVCYALSPTQAIKFAAAQPASAFFALAAVVLAITGAEALYVGNAVLKHFRVSRDGRQWSAAGWSTGGFCAAKLLLHHPNR